MTTDPIYEDCIKMAEGHDKSCRFAISTRCTTPVECEHGYDVCPTCDPCTCTKKVRNIIV